jgi:DNA-binding NtrC family response regulator
MLSRRLSWVNESLASKSQEKNKRPELAMPPALLSYFVRDRWQGKVRELENIVERIVVLARGRDGTIEDLPEFSRQERAGVDALEIDLTSQGIRLEAIEKELILEGPPQM